MLPEEKEELFRTIKAMVQAAGGAIVLSPEDYRDSQGMQLYCEINQDTGEIRLSLGFIQPQ